MHTPPRPPIAAALVALLALAASPAHAQKKDGPFAEVQDDPKLPRALLIGDSISIGYTLPTRALLKAEANLHRIPTNAGPTTSGLEHLDEWLGEGEWDVIHFNWGLHDLKYMNEKGQLVDVAKGRQQVKIDQYEKNLATLVDRLKKTGAKLIWCSTTPVPEGSRGRVAGDAAKYNEAAARVMKKAGVPTNDLYAFAKPRLEEIQRPRNVHFTQEGSKKLAERVAEAVRGALKAKED